MSSTATGFFLEGNMQTLTFGQRYDLYQALVYDRDLLADSLADLIAHHNARRILDCSAGTGLPAIDLIVRGSEVDCTDGSAEMLDQLELNACRAGVRVDVAQRDWTELDGVYGDAYDYVMCRGNSLIYATTWAGSSDAATLGCLADSLLAIVRTARIGGTVHLDFPRQLESAWASHPRRVIDGHSVAAEERVYIEGGRRIWELRMDIDDHVSETSITSAAVEPDSFIRLAVLAGLTDLRSPKIQGERSNYQVLLGTREK